MAKFKVGDKVRILDGSKIEDYTGNWNDFGMRIYVGKIDTIKRSFIYEGSSAYELEHNRYTWDERGLELVRENKFKVGDIVAGNDKADKCYDVTKKGVKCNVTCVCDGGSLIKVEVAEGVFKGREYCVLPKCFDLAPSEEITIKRYGNKVVAKYGDKTAVAKCSPEDTFDFATGAKLAFERLMSVEETPKFTKNDLKTGMFVLMSNGNWGVVVNDNIVYEQGGFDWLSMLNDNLAFPVNKINVVVRADGFDAAKYALNRNKTSQIVWRRGAK